MEEELKNTLADYLKMAPSAIGNDTVIDRSALGNSILLHRLYAAFSQQGYNVANYNTIRTFSDLKARLQNSNSAGKSKNNSAPFDSASNEQALTISNSSSADGVGIDIEDVLLFDEASDYREHSFYRNNFTEREISYCLLQSNPKASFTGLFAAKEAVVKAQNQFRGIDFNELEIHHDKNGKPRFNNFELSISHTGNLAIAVAISSTQLVQKNSEEKNTEITYSAAPKHQKNFSYLSVLALLFAFAAFVLALLSFLNSKSGG